MIKFNLNLECEEKEDIVQALDNAMSLVMQGYESGDLANEKIYSGSFDIGGAEEEIERD